MNAVTAIISYFVIWWVSLFFVLPFGVKRNDSNVPGVDAGAPEKSLIGRKMLINSVLAFVFFLLFYTAVDLGLISFRELANDAPSQR